VPDPALETPPRVAIYLRVSTADQTHEPQRQELLDFCVRKKWPAPLEFIDQISGAKFTRAGLDKMMRAVRKKQLDIILCVKLDRLGRSLPHLAQLIGQLDSCKVALICSSQGIDTSHDNPAGRLQMHVLMAVAEFERSLIRERTKAGLIAARARGARMGRPRVKDSALAQVRVLLAQHPRPTLRTIATATKVSLGKVAEISRTAQEGHAAHILSVE